MNPYRISGLLESCAVSKNVFLFFPSDNSVAEMNMNMNKSVVRSVKCSAHAVITLFSHHFLLSLRVALYGDL